MKHGLFLTLILSLSMSAVADVGPVASPTPAPKKTSTLPKHKVVKKKKVKIDFDSASEAGTHTTTIDGRTPLPLKEAEKDQKVADRNARPPKQLPEKKTRTVFHDEQTPADQAVVLARRPSEPGLANQETVIHRSTFDATIEGSQFGLDRHYAKPQTYDSAPAEMAPPEMKLQAPPPVTLLPQPPAKHSLRPVPLSELMAPKPTPTPVIVASAVAPVTAPTAPIAQPTPVVRNVIVVPAPEHEPVIRDFNLSPAPKPAPQPTMQIFVGPPLPLPTPVPTPIPRPPTVVNVSIVNEAPKVQARHDDEPEIQIDEPKTKSDLLENSGYRLVVRFSSLQAQYHLLENDLEDGAQSMGLGLARTFGSIEARLMLEAGYGLDQSVRPQNTRYVLARLDGTYLFFKNSIFTPTVGVGLGYGYFNVTSERASDGATITLRQNAEDSEIITTPAVGLRLTVFNGLTIDLNEEYLLLLGGQYGQALGGWTTAVTVGIPF